MEHVPEKRFPVSPKDYKLYEEIGEGVSATVYRALCIPLNEIVAIKVLDLEKCNNDLDGIRREVQTMSLIDHPNVLHAHCSFTAGASLWVVMPYMAGGSCLHIMKSAHPEGFEEPVIVTLLCEVLKALVYLHGHGHIHRDVKAGNILIDANGAVKLADFGVSACMFETGDRQRTRNTFVGTPCWMAPEVMQQLHGYDFKADVWSFGITALELAHGHAPFSKYPPMKVLLMTLQNAPPGLNYERDKRFSKAFKEMVAACLVKDPKKRPTSEKLLKHQFFKHARSNEYLARTILDDLSPLGERMRAIKAKDADFFLQNKAMYGDKEHLSQQEYIRGVSAWNFNLEELKAQAALIQASDGISTVIDSNMDHEINDICNDSKFSQPEILSLERFIHDSAANLHEDEFGGHENLEGSLASSFPIHPLQALKGCFDACEEKMNPNAPHGSEARWPHEEPALLQRQSLQTEGIACRKGDDDNLNRSSSVTRNVIAPGRPKVLRGSLLPEHLSPTRNVVGDAERDGIQHKFQSERNSSSQLLNRQVRDVHYHTSANTQEEGSEGRVVQHKGRFKVMSADVSPKGVPSTNCSGNVFCGASTSSVVTSAAILPSLQYILQQNTMQREQLIKLIKLVGQTSARQKELADVRNNNSPQLSSASSRERELQSYVVHLQQSIGDLMKEIQSLNTQNAQLERQLKALSGKEVERIQEEDET